VPGGGVELDMDGLPLAERAVRTLAGSVAELAARHGLALEDLAAVAVHGGNGRLPELVGRQLGVASERVWSETARTGNLGSASLPVAWAAHDLPAGPAVWAAVGAGLTWGAALFGTPGGRC
jgi:3-oxoacyl-[acyl-carrier-protein] synthase-3